jgi:hypothetical protein
MRMLFSKNYIQLADTKQGITSIHIRLSTSAPTLLCISATYYEPLFFGRISPVWSIRSQVKTGCQKRTQVIFYGLDFLFVIMLEHSGNTMADPFIE